MTVGTTSGLRRGSLTVVGVGITGAPQTTAEAIAAMTQAERLLYLVTDDVTEYWIRGLNPAAVSLHRHYGVNKPRLDTYREIHGAIVGQVFAGRDVCVAFYGHPGVLVHASHWAIEDVRRAGYPARMLPGVSAEGCLFADLGLNPGDRGWQCFEATDFLLRRRRFDPTSELILWQIGVLGDGTTRATPSPVAATRLRVLVRRLRRSYPASHRVTLYAAATFPGHRPEIRHVRLDRLSEAAISPLMTLYVPARGQRAMDRTVARWLQE